MATEAHPGHMPREREHEMRHTAEMVAGGAFGEFIGGAAAVVLSIIGLAGMFPHYLAAVSAIGIGAALMIQGGAISARFREVLSDATGTTVDASEIGGGVGAEFLGGAGAAILGVLALLGVVPAVLLGVATIVLGGTLWVTGGTGARLSALTLNTNQSHAVVREVARESVRSSAGAQILVGGGAIVLGILALVQIHPLILTLVAFLSLGASVLLSGMAMSGRLATFFHPET